MAITLKKFEPNSWQVMPFDCRVDLLNDFLPEEDDKIPNARHHIKQTLLENRISGCRFLTVDALKEAVGFYQKNGFQILATPETSDETVLMFFDLKKLKD